MSGGNIAFQANAFQANAFQTGEVIKVTGVSMTSQVGTITTTFVPTWVEITPNQNPAFWTQISPVLPS